MALTGVFEADFGAFYDAVTQAVSQLKGLNDTAGQIGTTMSGTISTLATAIPAAFVVHEIGQIASAAIESGSAIVKMSEQMGIATEDVQRLQYVAGQTGVSLGSLTTATQTVTAAVGTKNAGLVKAVNDLGLEWDAFAALDPYQRMVTLASGIAQIEDPTRRATVAAEAFGKNWKEILPAMLADMQALGREAPVMSDATVQGLNDIDAALGRASAHAKTWAGETVIAIEKAAAAAGKALSMQTEQKVDVGGLIADNLTPADMAAGVKAPPKPAGAEPLKELTLSALEYKDVIRQLNLETDASIKANKEAADEQKKWQAVMVEIDSAGRGWHGTLDTINGDVAQAVKYYLEAGVAQGTLAKAYALTETQVRAVASARQEEIASIQAQARETAALARLDEQYQQAVGAASRDTMQARIDNVWAAANAQIAAYEKQGIYATEMYDKVWAIASQTATNIEQKTLESDTASYEHYVKIADQAQVAYQEALAHETSYTHEHIELLRQQADAAEQSLDHWQDVANASLNNVKGAADQARAALGAVSTALTATQGPISIAGVKLPGSSNQTLGGSNYLVSPDGHYVPLGPGDGILKNNLPSNWFEMYTGKETVPRWSRAGGGPVSTSDLYMVGEHGPELFVPDSNGRILPNAGGGGSSSVVIQSGAVTINYPIMNDPQAKDAIARLVGDALMSRITRTGTVV